MLNLLCWLGNDKLWVVPIEPPFSPRMSESAVRPPDASNAGDDAERDDYFEDCVESAGFGALFVWAGDAGCAEAPDIVAAAAATGHGWWWLGGCGGLYWEYWSWREGV